jgi:hypothetical protein
MGEHRISPEFLRGFRHAVLLLGSEGDYREVDWSTPYEYLKGALEQQEALAIDFCETDVERRLLLLERAVAVLNAPAAQRDMQEAEGCRVPGMDWELSEKTKEQLAEIDKHIIRG